MNRLVSGLFVLLCLVACGGDERLPHRSDEQLVGDIVSLARERVGERIQLALIAAHGRPVSLDTPKIILLRSQGVSDRVIEHLITGPRP